ncbi:hypothetical protein GF327_05640 [Candidatus Woesearchaeota archaeon]|nr:hypothetical protein [Candidatus Woesearchaeota archaeon]
MKIKSIAIMMVVLTLFTLLVTAGNACEQGDPCEGGTEVTRAPEVFTCEVEINGEEVDPDSTLREQVERGENLDIKVRLTALEDVEDVQIDAFISGYEHSDFEPIHDSTSVFDVDANVSETKRLKLKIPDDIEIEDDDGRFKLRILITDRYGKEISMRYNLEIEAPTHEVIIKDILLDPANKVVSGRGLLASVRVKNTGERDEDSVKVTVSIPALDLTSSDYIDELEEDESETSEDLFLRIPACVEDGTYIVRAKVEYDDGYSTVSKQTSIDIIQDEVCDFDQDGDDDQPQEEKTIITVPGRQDVVQGEDVVYPIMISNTGSTSKTYTISVSGIDSFGSYRIDPSNVVVVQGRKTETAYLYVTAKDDASVGEKVFSVNVDSNGDTEQVPLRINIQEGDEEPSPIGGADWEDIKRGLEIGLVVLVILLVLLGLIVGFNKLKGTEEEDEEISGQTYY